MKIATADAVNIKGVRTGDRFLRKEGITVGFEFEVCFDKDCIDDCYEDFHRDKTITEGAITRARHMLRGTYVEIDANNEYEWLCLFAHLKAEFQSKMNPNEVISVMSTKYGDSDYSGWSFTTDSSVAGDFPIELVSPPMASWDNLGGRLTKALRFLKDAYGYTNSSTGLHVTLGKKQGITYFDPLVFAVVMGDTDTLVKFARADNHYTQQSLEPYVTDVYRGNLVEDADGSLVKGKLDIDAVIRDIRERMDTDSNTKYMSINRSKLDKGLIEYRGIGGNYLTHDTDDLVRRVKLLCYAFALATDKNYSSNNDLTSFVKRKLAASIHIGSTDKKDYRDTFRSSKEPSGETQVPTEFGCAFATKYTPNYESNLSIKCYVNQATVAFIKTVCADYEVVTNKLGHLEIKDIKIKKELASDHKRAPLLLMTLYKEVKALSKFGIFGIDGINNKRSYLMTLRKKKATNNNSAIRMISAKLDASTVASIVREVANSQIEAVKVKAGDPDGYRKLILEVEAQARKEQVKSKLNAGVAKDKNTAVTHIDGTRKIVEIGVSYGTNKWPYFNSNSVVSLLTGSYSMTEAKCGIKELAVAYMLGEQEDAWIEAFIRGSVITQRQVSYLSRNNRVEDVLYYNRSVAGVISNMNAYIDIAKAFINQLNEEQRTIAEARQLGDVRDLVTSIKRAIDAKAKNYESGGDSSVANIMRVYIPLLTLGPGGNGLDITKENVEMLVSLFCVG